MKSPKQLIVKRRNSNKNEHVQEKATTHRASWCSPSPSIRRRVHLSPSPTTFSKLKIISSNPPPYTAEAAVRDLQLLREGDPDETIGVPMIHSNDSKSFLDYVRFRNVGTVTRRIIVRPMKRSLYLERYAKDVNGEFVGTGKPAPDAGLVFIPSKSTPDELLQQVKTAVASRPHSTDPYGPGAIAGPVAFAL
jgi:hypothetical protein